MNQAQFFNLFGFFVTLCSPNGLQAIATVETTNFRIPCFIRPCRSPKFGTCTLSKSILVIAQACWELQTAGAVKGSTLDGTKILKSSIKQVSRKQNYLAPNFQKHGQQTMLRSMHEQEP